MVPDPSVRLDWLAPCSRDDEPDCAPNTQVSGKAEFVSGEIRVAPFGGDRVTPYLLAGVGRGVSHPNVNEQFPEPVKNDIWVVFGGAGVRLSVSDHFSLFADVRATGFSERDTISLRLPVRAGLAWRF